MVWPGNVRQLKNLVERVLILGDGNGAIEARELPQDGPRDGEEGRVVLSGTLATLPLRDAREAFEREYLLTQINRFGGNISRTANFVGMERSALHRKLKSLGVVTTAKGGARVAGSVGLTHQREIQHHRASADPHHQRQHRDQRRRQPRQEDEA